MIYSIANRINLNVYNNNNNKNDDDDDDCLIIDN